MEMVKFKNCTDCQNTAPISGMGNGKCRHCNGTGKTRKIGRPKHHAKCRKCTGTGMCQTCKGFGTI